MKSFDRLYRFDFLNESTYRCQSAGCNGLDEETEGDHLENLTLSDSWSIVCNDDVPTRAFLLIYLSGKVPILCYHAVDCVWLWKSAKLFAKYGCILHR